MTKIERRCPICGSKSGEVLYTHCLDLPELLKFMPDCLHIVCCNDCGMIYTSSEANQDIYNRYYDSIHSYQVDKNTHREEEDAYIAELREKEFAFIKKYIDTSYNVIDIGTGTGGMLQTFQNHGFHNLVGIDIDDKKDMMERRGFKFLQGDISSLSALNIEGCIKSAAGPCLYILNGVLEHVFDVRLAAYALLDSMKPDDLLFIMVPDADAYLSHFDRPYRFFGMEHINHFNEHTITSFCEYYGFEILTYRKFDYCINVANADPALCVLAKKRKWKRDLTGEKSIAAYIKKSKEYEIKTDNIIADLIISKTPIVIWGVGSYFMSLCKRTALLESNIVFCVDNNESLQGSYIKNIAILSPKELRKYPEYHICVISALYSDNILSEINLMGLPNKVLVL